MLGAAVEALLVAELLERVARAAVEMVVQTAPQMLTQEELTQEEEAVAVVLLLQ
jgi:hypothetical protein